MQWNMYNIYTQLYIQLHNTTFHMPMSIKYCVFFGSYIFFSTTDYQRQKLNNSLGLWVLAVIGMNDSGEISCRNLESDSASWHCGATGSGRPQLSAQKGYFHPEVCPHRVGSACIWQALCRDIHSAEDAPKTVSGRMLEAQDLHKMTGW